MPCSCSPFNNRSVRDQSSSPRTGSVSRQVTVTRTTSTPSVSSRSSRSESVPGPYCSHASSWIPTRRLGEAGATAGRASAASTASTRANRIEVTVRGVIEKDVRRSYESEASSSSSRAKRGRSDGGLRHMPRIGSPIAAMRPGIVSSVNASGSTAATSSH